MTDPSVTNPSMMSLSGKYKFLLLGLLLAVALHGSAVIGMTLRNGLAPPTAWPIHGNHSSGKMPWPTWIATRRLV